MARDMTEGNPRSHIFFFAIPIILGNLFQLMYNVVDSIIIARAAGTAALAAVNASSPVFNIIVMGVSGLAIGASVLISKARGAKDDDEIPAALFSLLFLGIIFSLLIMMLGTLASKSILRAIKVPEEILHDASIYLKLIMLGMPFTYSYNSYAAAMRAVGDSKTPLKYLTFSSVLNALLDVIFIVFFGLGVFGAALATVISQAVSALLCFYKAQKTMPLLRLKRKDIKLKPSIIKEILSYGSATALQQSCQPIGKMLIQSSINTLGVTAIAAYGACAKIEAFALVPEQSIASAMMTYVGQNRGAKNKKRIKEGVLSGLTLEVCYWVFICIVLSVFGSFFLSIFINTPEFIALGMSYLSLMAFFVIEAGFTNGIQGFFRGMGKMKTTILATLTQITTRVIFTFILVPRFGIRGVAFATAAGWTCMLLFIIPRAIYVYRKYDPEKD